MVREKGVNTNEQATSMFVELLNEAEKSIDIHDDGNSFHESVYNNDDVVSAMERCLSRGITIRCLFNDADQPLKILNLHRSEEYGQRLHVWYVSGGRKEPDTHYKIVDNGRLVHLSNHAHGDSEREYELRKAVRWWERPTRRRISRRYRNHFERELVNAKPAT